MKKIFAYLLSVFIAVTYVNTAAFAAESEISVTVDGEEIPLEQPPVIMNGRTLIPLASVSLCLGVYKENNGVKLQWDAEEKSVTIMTDDCAALLYIGSETMTYGEIGGTASTVQLEAAPAIVNGRTMVPARAVAEAFNCSVEWDGNTKTVMIFT